MKLSEIVAAEQYRFAAEKAFSAGYKAARCCIVDTDDARLGAVAAYMSQLEDNLDFCVESYCPGDCQAMGECPGEAS